VAFVHTKAFILLVLFALIAPRATSAAGDSHDEQATAVSHWGITLWGLSYHLNRNADYDETNWGLGLRYSARPRWRWLGKDDANRVFLQADAFQNSNRGLVVPISAGVQYRVATIPGGCRFLAVAALTAAYYQYPQRGLAEVKFGPVPGGAIACGRLTANVIAVLRKSSEPLAAMTLSLTIAID
jgi:hypothetical protein